MPGTTPAVPSLAAHIGRYPGIHWQSSAPIQPSRWLGASSSSHGYHGYQAVGGWGETLSSASCPVTPSGLCQNLGEAGGRCPARRRGYVCVHACVCVFGGMVVTMAVGAAQGFLREPCRGASRTRSASLPQPWTHDPAQPHRGGRRHLLKMSTFPESLTQTDVPVPAVPPIPQAMSAPLVHSPTWFRPGSCLASLCPEHVGRTLPHPARWACRLFCCLSGISVY